MAAVHGRRQQRLSEAQKLSQEKVRSSLPWRVTSGASPYCRVHTNFASSMAASAIAAGDVCWHTMPIQLSDPASCQTPAAMKTQQGTVAALQRCSASAGGFLFQKQGRGGCLHCSGTRSNRRREPGSVGEDAAKSDEGEQKY